MAVGRSGRSHSGRPWIQDGAGQHRMAPCVVGLEWVVAVASHSRRGLSYGRLEKQCDRSCCVVIHTYSKSPRSYENQSGSGVIATKKHSLSACKRPLTALLFPMYR